MIVRIMGLAAAVSMFAACGAPAQAASSTSVPQCLYSGPFGEGIFHNSDPPVRVDIDVSGRAVRLIHKVQTNYNPSNPFAPPAMAERPTCRLRLDCTVATAGLKSVVVRTYSANTVSDANAWVRVGTPVDFKYTDKTRDKSCHVTAAELM